MRSLVLGSLLACALALGSPAGCSRAGAQVASGVELYEKGAYEGALLRFQQVAPEEASMRKKARLRYLAYRGLVHWHLKELPEATRFLTQAQEAIGEKGADEKWLPADVREELAKACAELDIPVARKGDAPAPSAGPAPSAAPPASPSAAPSGEPPAPADTAPTPPAPTDPSAPTDPAAPPPSAASPTGEPPPPLPPGAGSPKAEPL